MSNQPLHSATESTQSTHRKQASLVLILLGAPGSGKGTQAPLLAKEFGIPHISTGDMFREHLALNTPLGKKARDYMLAGKLGPDELVLDMLMERISKPDCVRGYLLDGFPRTIPQAEALSRFLSKNVSLMALSLKVPDDVIAKRASGRLICRQCGHIYNKDSSPPKKAGICDKCGGEVYQRPDDTPEVVLERLKVYHHQTEPLLGYYQKQGVLANFNGNKAPDAVHDELKKYIDKVLIQKSN